MKKILITGGAGFIGSSLVSFLVNNKDYSILNFDKLTYAGNLNSLKKIENMPNYQMIKGDICDFKSIESAIFDFEPDTIFHLAAESHVDRSLSGPKHFIDTNILGTFNILEAARKFYSSAANKNNFRMLHISTDEVYGSLGDDGLFDEQTKYSPSSPYSASKAAADHLVKAWHHTYGLPTIVANCSNNYGLRQFPEKLIALNIINAIEKKPLIIYGDGKNIRDWLYVEDHVKALDLIAKNGKLGETYNIGGGNERTNLQVIENICSIFDEKFPQNAPYSKLITFVEDRPGHDLRYAIDASKIKNELGWRAEENFQSGLIKTVEWYLDNEEWWRPLRDNIYNGERLGAIKA